MFFFNSQDIFTSVPLFFGLFFSFITANGIVRIFKVIKCIENDKNSKYNIMYYEMSEQKFKLEDLTKQVTELSEKLNTYAITHSDAGAQTTDENGTLETIENVCNNIDNNNCNNDKNNCDNNDNNNCNNNDNNNNNCDNDNDDIVVVTNDKPRSLNTLWGLL